MDASKKKKGAAAGGDSTADTKKKGAETKATDVKKKGGPGVGDNAADIKKKEDLKAPSDGTVKRDPKCNASLLASCLKQSEGRASCNTCTPSYNLPKCNALNDDRLKCNQQGIPCTTCTPSHNPPPPPPSKVSFYSDENALSKSNQRSKLSTGTLKDCEDEEGSQDSSSCSSDDSHTWTSINDEKNPRYVALPKPCPSRIEKCPGSRRHSMPSSKLQCHCKSKKKHKESVANTCPTIEYPHNCPCNSKHRRASGSDENALKRGSTDINNSSQNSLTRRKSGSGSDENAYHTCPPKSCTGPRRTCPCKRKMEGPPTGFEFTCPCPRKSSHKPHTATACENACTTNRTSGYDRQSSYPRMSHPSMSFERDSPCPRKSKHQNDDDGAAWGPCPRKSKVFGIADPCKRRSEPRECDARPPCCAHGRKRHSTSSDDDESRWASEKKKRGHQEKDKSKSRDESGRLSRTRRSNSTDYSTSRTNFSDSRAERMKRCRSLEHQRERAFVNVRKQKYHSMSKIDGISAHGCRKASKVGSFTRLSQPNHKRSGSGCFPRKIKFMYDPPDPVIIHRRRWPPEYCSYCCPSPSPCDSYVACPAYMPCPCNQCPYC